MFNEFDVVEKTPHIYGQPGVLTTQFHHRQPQPRVAFITTYPPRECGIATFSNDLINAMKLAGKRMMSDVIAIDSQEDTFRYPAEVTLRILRDNKLSYLRAANYINENKYSSINIQHEYGLYGGKWGEYLITLMQNVNCPIVLTMHTVLEEPDDELEHITTRLSDYASYVVVLANKARQIFTKYYPKVDQEKLIYIPHGTPKIENATGNTQSKRLLNLSGRKVLSTFGFLSPDKGIEFAIKALPKIIKKEPSVVYLILGETHPGIKRFHGEEYRSSLVKLVKENGLDQHVKFENRYLNKDELFKYLQATDIYILPYLNPKQISSGTLAYALACGKSIISTPFHYASEVLSDGRGMLAKFKDPDSISESVIKLLGNNFMKKQMENKAFTFSQNMVWERVANSYGSLFSSLIDPYEGYLYNSFPYITSLPVM